MCVGACATRAPRCATHVYKGLCLRIQAVAARLLDDLLEHRSRINGTMRQQLHQEGQQWGLSGDQINAVISERLAANQVIRMRSSRRTMTFFGFTFVLLLGICGVLVYQILQFEPLATRPDSDTEATDPGPADASDASVATASSISSAGSSCFVSAFMPVYPSK